MKVGFGCDHTAVELKNTLMEHLTEKGYECVDFGAFDPNVKVNYPEPGLKVAGSHYGRRCGKRCTDLRNRYWYFSGSK